MYIFCRTARRWRIASRSWCFRRSAISVRFENIYIKSGFAIREEHTLKEENKPYVLMRCERAEEHYDREIEYLYGKRLLEKKDPILKEVLLHEEGKYSRLLESLKGNPTENAQKRLPEVEKKLALMREALECL